MKMRNLTSSWLFAMLGLVACFGTAMGEPETQDVDGLLNKLGADIYSVRRDAQHELVAWGRQDLKNRVNFFRQQQEQATDPEVQERCREIVKELVLVIVNEERDGFMGINLGPGFRGFGQRVEKPKGVLVAGVIKRTAAEKFGIKKDDLILKIDDLDVSGLDGIKKLQTYVGGKKNGTEIKVQILRDKEELMIPLTLMPRPLEADLPSRRATPPGDEIGADLTEAEKAQLERLRGQEVEKWLQENELKPSSVQ